MSTQQARTQEPGSARDQASGAAKLGDGSRIGISDTGTVATVRRGLKLSPELTLSLIHL
mgnify:CR=1 FL=1